MNNLNVKKGDTVLVLTGKDKGKTGKVLTANPASETVTVTDVNIVTKHIKPRGAQNPGGIQKLPGNTHVSNVMLICPECSKPTRIAHTLAEENGKTKSLRTCKKCGSVIDKAASADVKRAAKKSAKEGTAETKKKPARKAKTETTDTASAPAEDKPKKAAKASKPAEPDNKA